MHCMFCAKDRTLSREHVFASWICEHFAAVAVDADHERRLVTEGLDQSERHPAKTLEVVVRRVCRDCNSGWMREMDNDVRPLVEPMIDGVAMTLSILDEELVAKWATKMMLTMQAANIGRERVVGDETFRWFYQYRQPLPGSHVWLCHYTDRVRWPFVAHQWGMSVAPEGSPPPQEGDALNGFGVAFAIGELACWLFAADFPGGPRTQAGSDDGHLLIWPSLSGVRWPPPAAIASDRELGELARRLPTGTAARGLELR